MSILYASDLADLDCIIISKFKHIMNIFAVLSIDNSLGRVGKSTFSHQTLMEMFVEGIQDTSQFRDKNIDFLDIFTWSGVEMEGINVVSIFWVTQGACNGNLAFEWIPPTIENLVVNSGFVQGPLSLILLPRCMEWLDLSRNRMFGSLHIQDIPQGLKVCCVDGNFFSGSIDLTILPPTLTDFSAKENYFSGTIHLCSLPESIELINLAHNKIEGAIDLSCLPQELAYLSVQHNDLSGKCIVHNIPQNIETIDIRGNKKLQLVNIDGGEFSGSTSQIRK